MDEDDCDHEIRTPPVQRSNKPAERDLMIEDLQAVPCFSGRGCIKEGEKNTSDDLQHEHHERGAAEHVSPTCGLARDRVLQRFLNRFAELKPLLEPIAHVFDQAHGGLLTEMFIRLAVGAPVVGMSPAWISKLPCSTFHAYSNRPRSGGPDARVPSE